MATLPRGTVTFLFSDIEGSTRLLTDLGRAYETVLDDERRLLTETVEDVGGHIVDRAGDAIFAAFERAQDALAAAVAAQRAIAAHAWPAGVELRLRMGLHSGEPLVTGDGFVGLSVHKAARICAAGHGGQVLMSSTTRDLAEDGLPEDVVLLDLGDHLLKDFDRPERITQVVIGSLQAVLQPIRTVDAQPEETPFAGREQELVVASQAAIAIDAPPVPAPVAPGGHQLVDRLRGWRRSSRSRRGRRLAMEAAGMRLYASSRIAPSDELRTQMAKLGGAVAKLARIVGECDKLLAECDREALSRGLGDAYDAPVSERAVKSAELLTRQLEAVDVLAERLREFDHASRKLEPRLAAFPDRVFQARVDHAVPPDLAEDVKELLEQIELLDGSLGEARETVAAFSRGPSLGRA